MSLQYITNGITQDGFGARTERVIHIMAYTFYLQDKYGIDIEYLHTPFSYEGFGLDFTQEEHVREKGDNNEPYNEVNREGYLVRAKLWDSCLQINGPLITDINIPEYHIKDKNHVGRDPLFNVNLELSGSNKSIYIISTLHNEFASGKFPFHIIK